MERPLHARHMALLFTGILSLSPPKNLAKKAVLKAPFYGRGRLRLGTITCNPVTRSCRLE